MNNLGNIKFISSDPYKSRREFIKKKGDRPGTEWEDHIKEIEPLPFHTQEFPILFFDCNVCEIFLTVLWRKCSSTVKLL